MIQPCPNLGPGKITISNRSTPWNQDSHRLWMDPKPWISVHTRKPFRKSGSAEKLHGISRQNSKCLSLLAAQISSIIGWLGLVNLGPKVWFYDNLVASLHNSSPVLAFRDCASRCLSAFKENPTPLLAPKKGTCHLTQDETCRGRYW